VPHLCSVRSVLSRSDFCAFCALLSVICFLCFAFCAFSVRSCVEVVVVTILATVQATDDEWSNHANCDVNLVRPHWVRTHDHGILFTCAQLWLALCFCVWFDCSCVLCFCTVLLCCASLLLRCVLCFFWWTLAASCYRCHGVDARLLRMWIVCWFRFFLFVSSLIHINSLIH
jgi:hypothetical protein